MKYSAFYGVALNVKDVKNEVKLHGHVPIDHIIKHSHQNEVATQQSPNFKGNQIEKVNENALENSIQIKDFQIPDLNSRPWYQRWFLCCNWEYYKPFFDIDSETVFMRILASLKPCSSQSFFSISAG